ncbi:MAG: hypothetical protein Dasosvirus6_12 [Dasosvirus sp.]|uniref:Uncharacterized protein n=1 Tax=Dasosvirus sp. TaxID=2487764 RepID=A0A3G4ZRL4_9VIRU|nr:MAG: hypothetical protein Dasosvirus6_12 [Dasosvirus sp.]
MENWFFYVFACMIIVIGIMIIVRSSNENDTLYLSSGVLLILLPIALMIQFSLKECD